MWGIGDLLFWLGIAVLVFVFCWVVFVVDLCFTVFVWWCCGAELILFGCLGISWLCLIVVSLDYVRIGCLLVWLVYVYAAG